MNIFLIFAFLFFIGCEVGWGLEVFFRRFISKANPERKWINPGFLTGPYIPLYGTGLCLLYLLASLDRYSFINNEILNRLMLFFVMAICMTAIEFIAGILSEDIMHVKLWDYSGEKFNYRGIICLKFSIIWALLGAVYYFLIHDHILNALNWLSNNLAFSFFIGMFFGIFIIDLAVSINLVTKIRSFADEYNIVVRYEELKNNIRKNNDERKEKILFMFAFKSRLPLKDHLMKYLELRRAFEENGKK